VLSGRPEGMALKKADSRVLGGGLSVKRTRASYGVDTISEAGGGKCGARRKGEERRGGDALLDKNEGNRGVVYGLKSKEDRKGVGSVMPYLSSWKMGVVGF